MPLPLHMLAGTRLSRFWGVLGLLIGIPAAWTAGRAIQGLLFGVKFSDPLTYAAVAALLTAVAAVAGYLAAKRASALNLIEVLRTD